MVVGSFLYSWAGQTSGHAEGNFMRVTSGTCVHIKGGAGDDRDCGVWKCWDGKGDLKFEDIKLRWQSDQASGNLMTCWSLSPVVLSSLDKSESQKGKGKPPFLPWVPTACRCREQSNIMKQILGNQSENTQVFTCNAGCCFSRGTRKK